MSTSSVWRQRAHPRRARSTRRRVEEPHQGAAAHSSVTSPSAPLVYSLPLRLKFRKDGERRSWKAERCPGPQRWAPRALPESDAR